MDRRGDVTFDSNACCIAIITVSLMLFSQVTGKLVVAPGNRVASVGQSVHLYCSTDDVFSVQWQHFPIGSGTPKDVYITKNLVWPYNERFNIEIERSLDSNATAYNLRITDVRVEDAGRYRCIDQAGLGEERDAELTVLGSLPNCTTNIGSNGFVCENDCHYPMEEIRSSCSVEYAGNIAPQMQWKTTSEQDTIQPQPMTSVSGKTVSSELKIDAAKSMNGASVVWYSPQSTQVNWTSAPIKILYALKQSLSPVTISQSQMVTCSANSTQHCSYTWTVKTDQDNVLKTVEGRTLEVNQPGTYLCEANCPFHQMPCTLIAMHVEYRHSSTVAMATGISLCLVAIGGILFAIVICRRRLRREWNNYCASRSHPPSENGLSQSPANVLLPCLRQASNGSSSSSNDSPSQTGIDEEKPCLEGKSNGICNSSVLPTNEKERQVDLNLC